MGQGVKTVVFMALGIFLFSEVTSGQSTATPIQKGKSPCQQTKEERNMSIDEADRTPFVTRRIEFWGNAYVRDRDLRKQMVKGLREGDIFSRVAIEASVKRISKMKSIYPITMDNIEVILDRYRKDVDFIFCVRERPKR